MTRTGETVGKPAVRLTGTDGNVFALLGKCSRALRGAGLDSEAEEMATRVMAAGSYDEALQVMMQYVDAQ